MRNLVYFLVVATLFSACMPDVGSKSTGPLPVLGEPVIVGDDTLPHTIRDFSFMDQDSNVITNATFEDQAYVVDFFFISCPTICPKVKQQMLRIYNRFEGEDRLVLLSHTVDVKYDTIPRLKKYAQNLGVTTDRWHFVTGEQSDIYSIANDYFSIAIEDPDVPGGYDHSGRLILVDKDRQVRAFCTGTDSTEVTRFMGDIDRLLAEYTEPLSD